MPAREAEGVALQRCAPCALVRLAGPAPSPALPEDSQYAVLGLEPGATPAEVRRAYLRRVAADFVQSDSGSIVRQDGRNTPDARCLVYGYALRVSDTR